MKAPDKIFTDGRNISQMPVFDEQECIEYIRKDALMEWAKEKRAALLSCDATEERKVAALSVCEAFIEKIKSL